MFLVRVYYRKLGGIVQTLTFQYVFQSMQEVCFFEGSQNRWFSTWSTNSDDLKKIQIHGACLWSNSRFSFNWKKLEFSFLLNTTQPLTNPVDHSFVHSMVYKASTSHINQFMEHFVVKYARESSTVKTKLFFAQEFFLIQKVLPPEKHSKFSLAGNWCKNEALWW